MRFKNLTYFVILCTLLTALLSPSKSLATSWAYAFVVWDGYVYVVSEEYINETEGEIGHVTVYSDMAAYAGNFSNIYEKGTKYYSIEGISTDEAIAVQDKEGKFKKAIREGEYAGREKAVEDIENGRSENNLWGLILGLLAIFLISIFGIYYYYKKRMNW